MEPQETFTLDSHKYSFPSIFVELDSFRELSSGDIQCNATIETSQQPSPGLLYDGHLNLSSPRSRMDVLRMLEKRTDLADTDWQGILQYVSVRSKEKWRQGEPTVELANEELSPKGRYLLPPFLELGAICILFGDGGFGKSTIAEGIAVSVATGVDLLDSAPPHLMPVLVLDWETDKDTWLERLRAICNGVDIEPAKNIFYRHMIASLPESASYIRREIARLNIGLVICDSLGLAGGEDPEVANTKIAVFKAARSFQTTFLAVDHVAHHDKTRPFGSVYTRNIARLVWGIHKAQREGENRLTIALKNEKSNNSRLFPPRAFHLDYENDPNDRLSKITFTPCDYEAIPDFEELRRWEDRISAELRSGSKTVAEIARALNTTTDNIRKPLNRNRNKSFVKLGDKWANLAYQTTPS